MGNSAHRWIKTHTRKSHGKIVIASLLNIFVAASAIYFAFIMRNLIDAAVNQELYELKKACVLIILITIFLYGTNIISRYEQEKISVEIASDLRAYLLDLLMKKKYPEVRKKHSGEWINLLFSDIRIISEGASSIVPEIAGMVCRLVLAFISLAVLEPVLAIIYLCSGMVILIGVSLLRRRLKSLHKEVQKKEDSLHAFFQEVVENLMIVKAFQAEKYTNDKIDGNQSVYSEARLRRKKFRLLSINLYSFVFRLGYLLALIYGAYQLMNGSITYGTLTAVLHIVAQIQVPINHLSAIMPKVYETSASAERIMDAEKMEEEVIRDSVHEFRGMHIKDVSFSYGREEVLEHVSFDVYPDDIIALTGISGGGKSTLFMLMLGLYSPDEGKISIGSERGLVDASADTRGLFAYVPQGNALFTGTIRENIVFNHEYDQKKLEYALKVSEAYDFVSTLPKKEETPIGERGSGLSEGQLQRIAIARAVYCDAPVILLDESTSALDEETEAKVLENIRSLENKTVLIVTHRKAALNICTRHFNIENHRIEESD